MADAPAIAIASLRTWRPDALQAAQVPLDSLAAAETVSVQPDDDYWARVGKIR